MPVHFLLAVFLGKQSNCGDSAISNFQHVCRDWVAGLIVFTQNDGTKTPKKITMALREDVDEIASWRNDENRPAVNGRNKRLELRGQYQ